MAALFALAGVLLYAALIPGHVVSQSNVTVGAIAPTAQGSSEIFFVPMCHSGRDSARDSSLPASPASPQKKCPFCTGYAAFITATIGACDAGIIDAALSASTFSGFDAVFVESVVGHPQNRGSPLEL